ncbi:hypothetical protein J6590_039019 [Homalodisca vitripennis]|nr:hypothetical protein J6590_039019 [Homalodisca vitripennis]
MKVRKRNIMEDLRTALLLDRKLAIDKRARFGAEVRVLMLGAQGVERLAALVCGRGTKQRYVTNDELRDGASRAFARVTPEMLERIRERTWRRIKLCRGMVSGPLNNAYLELLIIVKRCVNNQMRALGEMRKNFAVERVQEFLPTVCYVRSGISDVNFPRHFAPRLRQSIIRSVIARWRFSRIFHQLLLQHGQSQCSDVESSFKHECLFFHF